jgi:hypothetical protein
MLLRTGPAAHVIQTPAGATSKRPLSVVGQGRMT